MRQILKTLENIKKANKKVREFKLGEMKFSNFELVSII